MPIPPFDTHGNLSVGLSRGIASPNQSLCYATLLEIHSHFVAGKSPRRAKLWDGWMRFRHALGAIPVSYLTLVDGSFVTTKSEPNDIDLCILLSADEVNRLDATERSKLTTLLADESRHASEFFCHVYYFAVHPFANPQFRLTLKNLTYWTRVYGLDRMGRQKALLVVAGGGTL